MSTGMWKIPALKDIFLSSLLPFHFTNTDKSFALQTMAAKFQSMAFHFGEGTPLLGCVPSTATTNGCLVERNFHP